MAVRNEQGLYIRPYSEVPDALMDRVGAARNPIDYAPYDGVRRILGILDALDRDHWAATLAASDRRPVPVAGHGGVKPRAHMSPRQYLFPQIVAWTTERVTPH